MPDEIAALYGGRGDAAALVKAFRAAAVLVPTTGDGRAWSAQLGGCRWLYAFSGEAEMAAFFRARGTAGDAELTYLRVEGWRLLDVCLPELGGAGGVALDVGSARPTVFPRVTGVAPDGVAVDARGGR